MRKERAIPYVSDDGKEEVVVYYCAYTYEEMFEVKVREGKSRYEIVNGQELASYWIMIEVAFYYISVLLTIIYLFKSHCLGISNSKKVADTSRGGT